MEHTLPHLNTLDTVLCEEIDVGESVVRTIASGIRPHYAAEDLVNRKVCVLANLKDRNLAGFKSQVRSFEYVCELIFLFLMV
jgi:tRNA-binding EMAP/Myf-like protein